MNRASLVLILSSFLVALSTFARAAEPDPFADPPEGKTPSTEEQEAAVLGTPERPAASAPVPAPPPPRRPVAAPRARQAQAQSSDEERLAAASAGVEPGGVAVELSTSGFASGPLTGGLFVGGRMPSGMIVGGFLDLVLTSLTSTTSGPEVTQSGQRLRLGVGLRHTLARSADRRVDVYGAGDVSFDYRSAEIESSGATPTESFSAAGFSLALGPGLRLWVHDQIALGYVARLRVTYLSGTAGALTVPPSSNTLDATLTEVGFDGTFQLLGVF